MAIALFQNRLCFFDHETTSLVVSYFIKHFATTVCLTSVVVQ